MLSKFKLFSGKKALVVKVVSFIYHIARRRNKLVVLEACTAFHFEHFKNVINCMINYGGIDVIVITPNKNEVLPKKNVTFYSSINEIPLYQKADIYISTEFIEKPYWFECPSVYFGHGIGPKFDYAVNKNLLNFDYIFSSYKPLYDLQVSFLSDKKVLPIGLPILDAVEDKKTIITSHFSLDPEKPILVYAPSWCADISKISNIHKILRFLSVQKNFNVIVSPHPLLFNPERCSGKDVFSRYLHDKSVKINTLDNHFTTLDLVNVSSIVISDISSILFEAMALNKKVIFDGNKRLYDYSQATHIYDELIKVCVVPEWENLNDKTITLIESYDELGGKRKKFINHYLFNNGRASEVFVREVNNIINRHS